MSCLQYLLVGVSVCSMMKNPNPKATMNMEYQARNQKKVFTT